MKQSFRVIKPYRSPFSDPLTAQQGERLRFERKESEWEGWIWCTSTSGQTGWVPENWVQIKDRYCIVQRDYTAAELSVGKGETITTDFFESGWAWASRESGESGWVPLSHLAPDPQVKVQYPVRQGKGDPICKFPIQIDGQEEDV